jgi:TRAP-type mannitol/chloroaromatic compound transport system permease small subunit
MAVETLLHTVDRISTWVGKLFSWLIIALMLTVCVEVFKRYALNAPTAWIYDANNMMYGTLFMMGGAYALAQDAHVRGDFFYGRMSDRRQAWFDLILFGLFFLPGVAALTWSGWTYAQESLAIREQTFNADPLPVYPFKFIIPIAGAILLVQGLTEMVRAVVCIRTGEWPARLKDAEEMDVVAQQLASSEYVDEDAKKAVIENADHIAHEAKARSNT